VNKALHGSSIDLLGCGVKAGYEGKNQKTGPHDDRRVYHEQVRLRIHTHVQDEPPPIAGKAANRRRSVTEAVTNSTETTRITGPKRKRASNHAGGGAALATLWRSEPASGAAPWCSGAPPWCFEPMSAIPSRPDPP
jgi:hypothetical protein